MTRAFTLFLAVVVVLLTAVAAAAQATERSMYVSVLDDSRRPVPDLGPEAFDVREDKRPREVLRASRASTPMEIAILIDNSQAAERYINDMRRALEPFVRSLASDGHQIALIELADRPTVLVDYTSAPDKLAAGVNRIFAREGSGTMLLDGIIDASRGLRKREADRRVIVAITTEGTDFSTRGYEHTLDGLRDGGAMFHALQITTGGGEALSTEEGRNRSIVLDRGTRASGGDLQQLLTGMALTDALQSLATELKQQYHVVFARPDTTVPPERVEVAVKRPGLTARGIVAPSPSKSRTGG
jgi:VWFA-related protein